MLTMSAAAAKTKDDTKRDTVSYLLRDIDADLWYRVKQRALTERIPMREAIERMLKHAAKHGIPE